MNFWYRYVPYMYLLPHYVVVIDGMILNLRGSHRHTVTRLQYTQKLNLDYR